MTEIVSRSQIGLRPRAPGSGTNWKRPITEIVDHWVGVEDIDPDDSLEEVCARWRGIQAYEMGQKGMVDIAYSYGYDGAGRIYELRGDAIQSGANGSREWNERAVAICYMAGPGTPLTGAAKQAAIELCQWLKAKHTTITAPVLAHSEVRPEPTACPGDEARDFLPTIELIPPPTEEDEMWVIEKELPGGTATDPGEVIIGLPANRKSANVRLFIDAAGASLWSAVVFNGGVHGLWSNGHQWELWLPARYVIDTAIIPQAHQLIVQNRGPVTDHPVTVTVSGT